MADLPSTRPTVAATIVGALGRAGVQRVYGLPGDSLNGFTDALRRDGRIAWEHVRHEEGAAFAAAAEATLTGRLAVCAASCGPGNLHLVNGLFDAQRSGVPVLAIAAHIPGPEIGSGYFQETHPQELFRECSVFAELAATPEQFPHILEIAMRTALERRGVSVLVVPGDVLLAHAPKAAARERPPVVVGGTVARPADADLRAAAELLDGAQRVSILAGAGCAGAHAQLLAIADALAAPVVHTLRGKEHVAYNNPFDVGMTGLLGFPSGYRALEHCDALLMLGTDFPYRQFLPEHARVVQVDRAGERIGRRTHVDVPLVGDVGPTCDALMPLLRAGRDRHHLQRHRDEHATARRRLDALAHDDGRTPIRPEQVAAAIDRLAADDAVLIPDVGTPVIWAARYLSVNGRRRIIGSFTHGSMANALPQAIGAQASHPGRQVIALSGDGGLAMLLGELITLRQQKLPVKVVVFDNDALGFVELEMKADGIPTYATDLDNPDFAAIAQAIGLHAQHVTEPDQLDDALHAALAHDGPALVSVAVARQELSLPPTITADQATGFALYALRSILSGRGHELVDLAQDNLVRRFLG